MFNFKKLGFLPVIVFAISAISGGTASAASTFTASATGSLTGNALTDQVLTINAGQVKCTTAATTGTIASTASPEQHVTVNYSGCTAFGFAAHISPATYLLTANGEVHIKETITINVTGGCHVTIGPQTVAAVGYETNAGKLKVIPNLTALAYASTGGICGASGANGTLTGTTELERVGGGSLTYDKVIPPRFTASATGSLIGKATTSQSLTINGGQMKCSTAETTGTITELNPLTQQHLTVQYKGCAFLGSALMHISPATYLFTANGEVHLQNSIVINVTVGGCKITIGPQTLKSVNYATSGSKLKVSLALAGIKYTSTGGLCGSSGANATLTGTSEIERVGGGSVTFDA